MIRTCLIAFLAIFLFACQPQEQEKADLILSNARVYTMEEDQPWAEAVAIKGNKILAVLSASKEVKKGCLFS